MACYWVTLGALAVGAIAGPSSPNFNGDSAAALRRRQATTVPDLGFYDPHLKDEGSMLTDSYNQHPSYYGEPLNVIISAHSDAPVLVDQGASGGLRNYFQSIGFSSECGGASQGVAQSANLGDGHGWLNQTAVIRWDYGNALIGTCRETIDGGNHFRYWTQNGPDANSGAYFLALSYEKPLNTEHQIIIDGYNLARDWLVGNATQFTFPWPNPLATAPIPTPSATLSSGAPTPTPSFNSDGGTGIITSVPNGQFQGTTSANGYTYQTTATYVSGLMGNTSIGINHNDTITTNGMKAVDGLVAVLVVKILNSTASDSTQSGGASGFPIPAPVAVITSLFAAATGLFHGL